MKKLFLMRLMLLFSFSVFLFSCDDEVVEEPKELLPKLDGFYIYGTNTVAESAVEPNARMALAVLDPSKAPNVSSEDSVYGKWLYIGANSTIKFAKVISEVGTIYGAEDGGTVSLGTDVGNVNINDEVIHGTLEADATPINVEEEGLYYAFANAKTGMFVLMKVKAQMIGDSTPDQWATGTPLPEKFVSKDSAVFELTGLTLKGESGYRYRFNDGWAVYEEAGVLTTLSSMGVFSYGESWPLPTNDIGFYTDNAPHQMTGIFTVKLKYTASTGLWSEKKTKTGEVLVDYSGYEVAIVGDAIEGTCFCGDGTGGYQKHAPTKAGNIYTWTWNDAVFIAEKEFIFLQNATWGGLLVDFPGAATVNGTAVADGKIVNATTAGKEFANYYVATGGTYDVTLKIDATDNSKTVTINNN